MPSTSEEGAVPLRDLNPSPEGASTDTEEARDNAPFIQQGDEIPFIERAINIPQLYAHIRRIVHYTLDHTPLPDAARTYLRTRWFGVFISVISVLAITLIAGVTGILLSSSSKQPTPVPDPFSDWATDMGPNSRTTLRLANSLVPIQYRLFFYFHMDDSPQRFRYEGRVAINVEVTSPLDVIDKFLIHAHKYLEIDFKNFIIVDDTGFMEEMTDIWESFPYIDEKGVLRAGAEGESQNIPKNRQQFGRYEIPNVTRLDDDTLQVKVTGPFEERSQKLILIHFNGTMRDNPPGIFVNKIHNSDDYWLATQFQPSLARAAFPCFDEPSFRSTFYLSVAHPSKYEALSNMLRIQTRPVSWKPDGDHDYIWSTFSPSIVMPPYLFGFVIGPFKSLELKRTKNVPETKLFALNQDDLVHRTVFAANVTVQAMTFAKEYFDLDYPMSKLYMVTVPSKQPIDSESWGLILYREDAILLNSTTATVESLEKVARNVVHYIIHQWVGNIVGPAWWDDLWATEALIGYIENVFLEEIFPEWHVWESFATLVVGEALKMDVRDGKHAVFALPRIPYYPMAMFDTLTSHKGAAIFRMMELYSPGSIQKAVRSYLSTRTGRSVSANILFQDLHFAIYSPNATSEDGPPTVEVMLKWTRESGYPLVSVVRYTGSSDISLFQEIFDPHQMINQQSLETHEIPERKCHHASRHQRVAGSTTAWSVPIDFLILNGTKMARVDNFWQTTNFHRVCGGFPGRSKYIIANYDQKGFFRVDYDSGNWQLIGHEMMHNPKVFSRITRAMLIDDALAMAKIGRLSFVQALEMPLALLHQGIGEKLTAGDVGMYERAMRAVADVHDCLRGSKLEGDFLDYMRLIAGAEWAAVDPPHRRKLEKANSRNHTDILGMRTSILLQEQAIFWACYTGMTECTDWAVEIVQQWQQSQQSAQEDLIEEHYSNAYCAAVRYGPDTHFEFLWNRYNQAGLSDKHKQEILWALLCTNQQKKIVEIMGGLPGKRALVEDTIKLWKKMENRRISAWYAFKYERAHWDNIHSKMFNSSFFSQIIVAITSALSTPDDMEDIQAYRRTHNESLWDIQDLLEENVHNIRKRLYFRAVIEETLKEALDEMLPLAEAVKRQTDAARSPTPPPLYAYTESRHEPLTPHPAS